MKVIEWLLEGDPVLQYLTGKYILDRPCDHINGGYIGKYLLAYDATLGMWGGGIYSPKWISSTYTLLDLKYMEIKPDHPVYQAAMKKVLDGLWPDQGRVSKIRYQDMCMSAMVLSLISYGKLEDDRVYEILDYILAHQMEDGGWNCNWDSLRSPSVAGSVHTTLSVLEALADYEKNGYAFRLSDVKQQSLSGEKYLLDRKLFRSLRTGKIIHRDMISFHFPFRWKYDCFRVLEYFVRTGHPFDIRMEESMDLLRSSIKKGHVSRGRNYPGKIHFPLESGPNGRFNTFRALMILKVYDKALFENILQMNFRY